MYRLIPALIALLLLSTTAFAQLTHYYETVDKYTKKLTDHSKVRFDKNEFGQTTLHFEEGLVDYPQQEEHLLNEDFSTLSYSLKNEPTQTNFSVRRLGDVLTIQGQLNGASADKSIAIDSDPFFGIPKFNLARFILSDKKKITFWTLRDDDLNAYKLIATRQGNKEIVVNGLPVDAIKVYVTTVVPLFRLFKRIYYFRPSDGLFLKQEYPDGRVRELIKEE